jgi:hypothetical protein
MLLSLTKREIQTSIPALRQSETHRSFELCHEIPINELL